LGPVHGDAARGWEVGGRGAIGGGLPQDIAIFTKNFIEPSPAGFQPARAIALLYGIV
jgi:hypothetical protein